MSTVKRFFLYALALVNLGIFAGGVNVLLTLVFDLLFGDTGWRSYSQGQLSMGLAMLIIAGTLWILFWRIVQREVSADTTETGSGIRKLYLNLVLAVTAIIGLSNFFTILRWILSGVHMDVFPSGSISLLIVTACLWIYHRSVENKEGQPSPVSKTLRRWYTYILVAVGLSWLTNGIVQIMNASSFYLPVWGEHSVRGGIWENVLSENISWIVTGAFTWWYFWFRVAKDDYQSVLRQVYLYLLTITGSTVAGLVAVVTILYQLLSIAFTDATGGGLYFRFLGWTIPTLIVAAAVWFYHRKIVEEEAEQLGVNRFSPRRLYLYLMGFIGLGTMIAGIYYLLGVLFDRLFDIFSTAVVFSSGWWGEQLSLSLALLLVSVPIWIYYWRKIIHLVEEGGVTERGARSRRIYLYAVLGFTIIAAVSTLVIIVYQVINGILQSDFGTEFLRNIIWSLSGFLVAVPVLVYHWRILREDQNLGAEKLHRRKRVNILAGEEAEELVDRIEEKLGFRVRRLVYKGEVQAEMPVLTDEDIESLVHDIGLADGESVIMDITGGSIRLLPYGEK
ncbi:MAG: hypothetical protein JSU58_11005 [Dehalococcoidales bacterium]|nr:MAG: hypothetical protein JSU58_11005 [Dehalococcoidales bacterium]